jgi:hypothetical protein
VQRLAHAEGIQYVTGFGVKDTNVYGDCVLVLAAAQRQAADRNSALVLIRPRIRLSDGALEDVSSAAQLMLRCGTGRLTRAIELFLRHDPLIEAVAFDHAKLVGLHQSGREDVGRCGDTHIRYPRCETHRSLPPRADPAA